jgi:hypothetical protein
VGEDSIVSDSEAEREGQRPHPQSPATGLAQTLETVTTFTQTQREPTVEGSSTSEETDKAKGRRQFLSSSEETTDEPKEQRQFLSSSTEGQQEEEEPPEAIPGAIESDEIQADMSSESDGEQHGLVTVIVQWRGEEHRIEVPPRIRHERLCQRIKRD